jgi:hypothetical protein
MPRKPEDGCGHLGDVTNGRFYRLLGSGTDRRIVRRGSGPSGFFSSLGEVRVPTCILCGTLDTLRRWEGKNCGAGSTQVEERNL